MKNFIKKLSSFIVRFRIIILLLMVGFTALCAFLIFKVNINKDMTKYLSDSSQMKQGIDMMDKEFPDSEDEYSIRLMLENVPEEKKSNIKKELEDIPDVKSVSFENDEEYNKDNLTLYEISTSFDYDTSQEKTIENSVLEKYDEYSPIVENQNNDVVLPSYIIISLIVVLLGILFLLSASWLEPLIFMIVIGCAILVNMGTNFFLPSVSNTTFSIAAILQLVLSMDYSVMLMNRYRQEREHNPDKKESMKTALCASFSSITSSAFTTFVGLLMLIFMQYKIGADLGIVLAKGVICSLLCIFTILPALIILMDKVLAKTKKPYLNIPMGGLAKFSHKLRFVLPAVFAGIFVIFFFLQKLTPISFDGTPNREIAKIFPESNPIVVMYDNSDSKNILALEEKLEKIPGVTSTASYESTIAKERDVDDMADFINDFGTDSEMDSSDLKLVFYDYHQKGVAPNIKLADLMNFINKDIIPNDKYNEDISNDVRENAEDMIKFSDIEALKQNRSYTDMAHFFGNDGMNTDDLRLMYTYYFANQDSYFPAKMSLNEFVNFVQNDIANDETIRSYSDDFDISEIDTLSKYIDTEYILKEQSANEISSELSMDTTQAEMLYSLYYGNNMADSYSLTLTQLVNYMQNSSFASSGGNTEQLKRMSDLAKLAKSGRKLNSGQMSDILNISIEQISGLYMMYGLINGNVDVKEISLPDFTNFLVKSVLTNPEYSTQFDTKSKEGLKQLNNIVNIAVSDAALSFKQSAALMGTNEASMRTLYALKSGSELKDKKASLKDITDFIINNSGGLLAGTVKSKDISKLKQLQYIMNSALSATKYSYNELTSVLGTGIDIASLKNLYVMHDAKLNPDFAEISVVDFVNYLENDIFTNPEMSEFISEENRSDLHTLNILVNAVVSEKEYDYKELSNLFMSMGEDINPDDMYLMSLLYGSMYRYNNDWKMSMLSMFNFLYNDILNDSRFASFMDEDTKKEIEDGKIDLEDAVKQLKGPNMSRLVINSRLPYESDETYAFADSVNQLCHESLNEKNYKIGSSVMYSEMKSSFSNEMLLITILTIASIFTIVAITFKNIFIPALLFLIVLCGVFITVGVSGLRGVSINYLANIIVQCILMGSCIDYGILFVGLYRDNRKNCSIIDSLKNAYNHSIHTVLTSGLIMVLVTGIIGFTSTDPSIGPICLTLSIGSLSAILLILFILPGMLAIFDRFIVKKTVKQKSPAKRKSKRLVSKRKAGVQT